MGKLATIVLVVLITVLAACQSKPGIVEVTRLVKVTVEVTRVVEIAVEVPVEVTSFIEVTPKLTASPQKIDISDIDIEALLVENGDLPAVISAGQFSDSLLERTDLAIGDNNPLKVVARELHNDELDKSGAVYVMLFVSADDAASQYEGFVSYVDSELGAYSSNSVDSVGDFAFVARQHKSGFLTGVPPFDTEHLVFTRCNAVIYLVLPGEYPSRGQALAYAKRLDARLAPLVCD